MISAYRTAIEELLELTIVSPQLDLTKQIFSQQAHMTPFMKKIISDCLEQKFPNQAFTYLFWQRRSVDAIGHCLAEENSKYRARQNSTIAQNMVRSDIFKLAFGQENQPGFLTKQEKKQVE
jgi:hypothetical protein